MHAYTGNWTTSHYIATERVRLAADRKRAADNRRKHRSLDRRERLLADLEAVDKRLRAQGKLGARANTFTVATLLRRRNKLVDALNSSQREPLEVAS
jgi:hypothetical protein